MIYLDNCATTMLAPQAAADMARVANECFGNPGSIHTAGQCAARELMNARELIAGSIHARPSELVLTSSGSEANNLVVGGTIRRCLRTGAVHVITTTTEHASVAKLLEYELMLHPEDLAVTWLGVNSEGKIDLRELENAVRDETRLVTILHCNNETGALQDIDAIAAFRLRHPGVLLHLDVVQSYLKVPLDVRTQPVDFLTASAHKVHGPKGAGFAYLCDGVEVEPVIIGGAQEKFRRAGTENVIAAAGFAAAVSSAPEPEILRQHLATLEKRFLETLEAEKVGFQLNGSAQQAHRMMGTFNLSFDGIRNKEDLQIACDLEGLMVSSTAACHAGVVEDSHVLSAMGVTPEHRAGALRICFSRMNTLAEAQEGARILARCVRSVKAAI